jgi:hypothetical protein
MGTESEVVDPASVDMDLHDWRRMKVSVARRRTCDQVLILFWQRWFTRGRRDVCLYSSATAWRIYTTASD